MSIANAEADADISNDCREAIGFLIDAILFFANFAGRRYSHACFELLSDTYVVMG